MSIHEAGREGAPLAEIVCGSCRKGPVDSVDTVDLPRPREIADRGFKPPGRRAVADKAEEHPAYPRRHKAVEVAANEPALLA